MAIRNTTTRRAQDPTLRHLWLAGLGATVVARREASKAIGNAIAKVEAIRDRIGAFAGQARAHAGDGLASLRSRGELRARRFGAGVEAGLTPVLAKLGLNSLTVTANAERKARRTATNRNAARTGAKRAGTRAAPVRTQTAKRKARKVRA
ncbi:MAG TPA: hypothetical protein VEY92_01725 [Pseudoxanthomonas sp.]|nr:hypothetical protein [Pseudoxanthomonas sp.]